MPTSISKERIDYHMSRRYDVNRLLFLLEQDDSPDTIKNCFTTNKSPKLLMKAVYTISQDPNETRVIEKIRVMIQSIEADHSHILNIKPQKILNLIFKLKITDPTIHIFIELFSLFRKPLIQNRLGEQSRKFFRKNINNYILYKVYTQDNRFDVEILIDSITDINMKYIYEILKRIAIANRKDENLVEFSRKLPKEGLLCNIANIMGQTDKLEIHADPEIYKFIDPHQKDGVTIFDYTKLYLCYLSSKYSVCHVCKFSIDHLERYFRYNKIILEENLGKLFSSAISTSDANIVYFFVKHSSVYATKESLDVFLREIYSNEHLDRNMFQSVSFFPLKENETNEIIILNLFQFIQKHKDIRQYTKALEISVHLLHTKRTVVGFFSMVLYFIVNFSTSYIEILTKNAIYRNLKTYELHIFEILKNLLIHQTHEEVLSISCDRNEFTSYKMLSENDHQKPIEANKIICADYDNPNFQNLDCKSTVQTQKTIQILSRLFSENHSDFMSSYMHEIACFFDKVYIQETFELEVPYEYDFYRCGFLAITNQLCASNEKQPVVGVDNTSYFVFLIAYCIALVCRIPDCVKSSLECDISNFLSINLTRTLFTMRKIFYNIEKTRKLCIFQSFIFICDIFHDRPELIANHLHPFVEYFLTFSKDVISCNKCNLSKVECKRKFLKKYTNFISNINFSNLLEHIKKLKFYDDYIFLKDITVRYDQVKDMKYKDLGDFEQESDRLLTESGKFVEQILTEPLIIFYGKSQNHLAFTILHKILSQIVSDNISQALLFLEEVTVLIFVKQVKLINEYTLLWYNIFLKVSLCFINLVLFKSSGQANGLLSSTFQKKIETQQNKSFGISQRFDRDKKINNENIDNTENSNLKDLTDILINKQLDVRKTLSDIDKHICDSIERLSRTLCSQRTITIESDYGLQNLFFSQKYHKKFSQILQTASQTLEKMPESSLAMHIIGFIGCKLQKTNFQSFFTRKNSLENIDSEFDTCKANILAALTESISMEDSEKYFYAIQETLKQIKTLSLLSKELQEYVRPFLYTNYTYKEISITDHTLKYSEDMSFEEFLRETLKYFINILKKNQEESLSDCLKIGLIFNKKILRFYVEIAVRILFAMKLKVFDPIVEILSHNFLENIDRKIISFILDINIDCEYSLLHVESVIPAALKLFKFHYIYKYCSKKPYIQTNGYDLLQFIYFALDDRDNCLAINSMKNTFSKLGILYELLLEKDFATAKHLIKRYNKENPEILSINTRRKDLNTIQVDESSVVNVRSENTSFLPHACDFSDSLIVEKYSEKNKTVSNTFFELFSQKPPLKDQEIMNMASSSASQTPNIREISCNENTRDDFNFFNPISVNETFKIKHVPKTAPYEDIETLKTRIIDTDEYKLSYIIEKYNKSLEEYNVSELIRSCLEKVDLMHVWSNIPEQARTKEVIHAVYDLELVKANIYNDEVLKLIEKRRNRGDFTSHLIYDAHSQILNFYQSKNKTNEFKSPNISLINNLKAFNEKLNYEICKFLLKNGQEEEFKARVVEMQIHDQLSGHYLMAQLKSRKCQNLEAQIILKKLIAHINEEHFLHEKSWLFYSNISKSCEIFTQAELRIKNSEKLHYSWAKYLEINSSLEALDQYILSFLCGKKLRRQSFPKILHILTEGPDFGTEEISQKSKLDHYKKSSQKFQDFLQKLLPSDYVQFFSLVLSKISHKNSMVVNSISTCCGNLLQNIPHKTVWSALIMLNSVKKEIQERMKRITSSLSTQVITVLEGYLAFSNMLVKIGAMNSKNAKSFSLREKIGFNGKIQNHIAIPNFDLNSRIVEIKDEVRVFVSLQAPKKITLVSSEGIFYSFLCKNNDDLRKDSKFMDISCLLNDIFSENEDCKKRECYIKTYNIVPITPKNGIIEWVDGLVTLRSILDKLYCEIGKNISVEQTKHKKKRRIGLSGFPDVLERFPPLLQEYFDKFTDPVEYYHAHIRFTRTCAVMSIVGWFMGLGDRHLDNILINERDGSIFHVDLNCIFDKGTKLEIAERVPFRLTQNIIAAFGPLGVSGAFRKTMEVCYHVMAKNKDLIITNMLSIVYDPLHDIRIGKKSAEESSKLLIDSLIKKLEKGDPYTVCDELISNATDPANLAEMFIGWCPFI